MFQDKGHLEMQENIAEDDLLVKVPGSSYSGGISSVHWKRRLRCHPLYRHDIYCKYSCSDKYDVIQLYSRKQHTIWSIKFLCILSPAMAWFFALLEDTSCGLLGIRKYKDCWPCRQIQLSTYDYLQIQHLLSAFSMLYESIKTDLQWGIASNYMHSWNILYIICNFTWKT